MPNTNDASERKIKSEPSGYSAPHLIDYGAVSELTETDAAGTGFDGGDTPSSYIS